LVYLNKVLKDNKILDIYKIKKNSDIYLFRCNNQKKNYFNNDKENIRELEILNNNLNLQILKLTEELNKEKEKNENLTKKLKEKKELPKEELISVIFISENENIYHSIICKKTDTFLNIENSLYNSIPYLKELKIKFFVDGIEVKKDKNLIENKIGNNSLIIFK